MFGVMSRCVCGCDEVYCGLSTHEDQRREHQVLYSHSLPSFFEAESLTEPRARLVVDSSPACSAGVRSMGRHAQLFTMMLGSSLGSRYLDTGPSFQHPVALSLVVG